MNPYYIVIALSCVIILSHLFNIASRKTNVPSVILLILLGIGIKYTMEYFDYTEDNLIGSTLEILGIVGLIMIVLEAAIDLELSKEKWPIIWKSFLVALISLVGCSFLISLIINQFFREAPFISLVYAIPLAVVSSAIVIPSVGRLIPEKKEFLIYESTFSDILGIMFFSFLIQNADAGSINIVVYSIIGNIFITVVVAFVLSYGLVMLFQRIESKVKLFLLIAILVLLYALGKQLHLSSLVIILVFGVLINNCQLFFFGRLKKWINHKAVENTLEDLHLVTRESAFVIRTFFFVVFGTTINLSALLNLEILGVSLLIVAAIFLIRFIVLKMFFWRKSIQPELFISPRGLITILLFFSIPEALNSTLFNSDVILIVILVTSVIMTWGLIRYGKKHGQEEKFKLRLNVEEYERPLPYFVERMSDGSEKENRNSDNHKTDNTTENQ